MKMKKFFSILITICMVTLMFPLMSVSATEKTDTVLDAENTNADVTHFDYSKPIRVGYYATFDDMIVNIDSLNNKGYGYEVFQKISERSGLEFEFVPIADSMIEAVQSGYVDVGGFNTRNDERRELVYYSQNPYSKTYIALMTEDMSITYADVDAINGKTVAVYDENIGVDNLDFFCEENNISVNYLYGATETYMQQEADLYITYSEDPTSQDLNNILNLGVYNLYLISSFENADLMEVIDAHYLDVIHTEGNFFMELEEKYLSENIEIAHRGLSKNEIATLQQRPLEVGYVTGFSPISYTNEKGEPDGVMADIQNEFSERYGFEVNYHPYSLEDEDDAHDDFDVLLTLYGDGDHELEHYAPTETFHEIEMYAVVNNAQLDTTATHEIMQGAPVIGSLPYQTIDFDAFLAVNTEVEFVFYNNWHKLLDDLAAGNVDMLICTESAATYTELYFDDVNTSTIQTDTVAPMRLFINHDIADEYVPIFNVMSDRISEREYTAIIETNSNEALPEVEAGFWELAMENWYYFAILFFIIVAGFIALHYKGQIEKKEALLKSYNTDPMTGLMTINKFRVTAEEIIKKAKPGEYELISFDVDMFKTINTHFSTDRGTAVIVAIANSLKKSFEGTDAVISRRTADQFVIFRRVNEGGAIRQICNNNILPEIEENINEKYKVSLSFGNVIINDVKAKVTSLIGQADNARLEGKSIHKTTFITFDDNMKKQYENKINITFRMEQALKEREFIVEYQPKIDFNTLKLGGAEALVRWKPSFGDKVYPDEFIPIFEENGFISYLDLYVLEEVCKCIKTNCNSMKIPRISVNLSAHTVLSKNIVSRVSDTLALYGIDASMIELELTESAVEANTDIFLSTVKKFKGLGFSISIDDFGAGVSSLNRLSAVEADILKLDKAFFSLKDQGAKSTVVVTDVINMAKHLNMKVVAEGVETAAQALWLQGIGCDYAQGYYFAKPMSEEKFKELLRTNKEYSISLT